MDLLKSQFIHFQDKTEKEVSKAINDVQSTPIGSHFGEAGERLRSARTRGSQSRPTSAVSVTSTKISSNHDLTKNNDFTKKKDAVPAKIPITKVELTDEEKEIEKHIINVDDKNSANGLNGDEDVDIW